STLVFVLTITLGFILFRNGIKLYIERRRNREGSRIELKLYFGALALSFMPVCFLVVFSYMVLNRQIEKWFFWPRENIKLNYQAIANALEKQLGENLELQATALASRTDLRGGKVLQRFCEEQRLVAAEIVTVPDGQVIDKCGDTAEFRSPGKNTVVARRRVHEGAPDAALISLAAAFPLDVADTRRQISTYVDRIAEMEAQKKPMRYFYILM